MTNIFKKKDKAANPFNRESDSWWESLKKLFIKDTGCKEDDPEFTAQNIYQHWIKSYLGK